MEENVKRFENEATHVLETNFKYLIFVLLVLASFVTHFSGICFPAKNVTLNAMFLLIHQNPFLSLSLSCI